MLYRFACLFILFNIFFDAVSSCLWCFLRVTAELIAVSALQNQSQKEDSLVKNALKEVSQWLMKGPREGVNSSTSNVLFSSLQGSYLVALCYRVFCSVCKLLLTNPEAQFLVLLCFPQLPCQGASV